MSNMSSGGVEEPAGEETSSSAKAPTRPGPGDKGRVQKLMLGKLVDFSIKWVGGVVHQGK